jgi:hypothetical protein
MWLVYFKICAAEKVYVLQVDPHRALHGYPSCGTIVIEYHIPDGVQTAAHPHPGRPFKGAHRKAYLPHNQEGIEVVNVSIHSFMQSP